MSAKEKINVFAIGMQPPPVTGQSLAFEVSLKAFEEYEEPLFLIDINEHSHLRKTGSVTPWRIVTMVQAFSKLVFRLVTNISKPCVTYLHIGYSLPAFVRDALFIWVTKLFGKIVIIHSNGGGYDELLGQQVAPLQWFMIKTLRQVNTLIVLDDFSATQFEFDQKVRLACRSLPYSLPLGVMAVQKSKLYDKSKPFRILYLSNLIISKGFLDVLDATLLLASAGYDVVVELCGDFRVETGAEFNIEYVKNEFDKAIEAFGDMKWRVQFQGFVADDRKKKILERANAFVLPTYYAHEGQPISIIEAMAHATPVITTRYRGIPSLIDDGVQGFFVTPQNPKELAKKLEELISNPELYKEMSSAALNKYRQNHSTESYKQTLMDIFHKAFKKL